MDEQEGVIKYQLEFQEAEPLRPHDFSDLLRWHHRFKMARILGQDPGRYEGYGFGNISERLNQVSFVISGTQTGHLDVLGPRDYAVVVRAVIEENRIISEGPVKPSSEALTHAAVYALDPDIRFVFHVHSPGIWQVRKKLNLPETAADIPYGTPEMAGEVKRLFDSGTLVERSVFAMAGHEDGIVGFGRTADEAGDGLMRLLGQTPLTGKSLT